jgi:Tol biopolymer transport system component
MSSLLIAGLAGCAESPSTMHSGAPQPAASASASAGSHDDANEQRLTPPARPTVQLAGVSLWGELPGANGSATSDASENLRQVSFSREGSDFDVTVDPTGKYIAFASTQHRNTSDIYIKRVDGSTVTQLTSDPANDVMPTFSPDGSMIAYCSDRTGNFDIYIQKLDGGQPVQITNDPSQEFHPSFSPDGKQLVFCSLSVQSGQWEIVVVDVANPAKRKFLGFGLFPAFSPDGTKIVFQRASLRGTKAFSVWTIDYINGEGVRPTQIAAAANAAVINPCFSPDGKRLAFATVLSPSEDANARPEQADLWAINLDGSGRTKLTNDKFANLQPCWGKDDVIYFVSNRGGFDNIWSLRPDAPAPSVPAKAGHATAEVPTNN